MRGTTHLGRPDALVFAIKAANVARRRTLARYQWDRLLNEPLPEPLSAADLEGADVLLLFGLCECEHAWVEHSRDSGRCMGHRVEGNDLAMCDCGWVIADGHTPGLQSPVQSERPGTSPAPGRSQTKGSDDASQVLAGR